MKGHEAYKALPAKVAQWVLRLLDKNWHSYFTARAAWQDDPSRFLGHPKLPGYKDKQHGRNPLVYTIQALSVPALRQGVIAPSMLGITVRTRQVQQSVQQVRIIPRQAFYVVELIYEREPVPAVVNPTLRAGIDSGLNNLATLTADKLGVVPRLVNGRPVKSASGDRVPSRMCLAESDRYHVRRSAPTPGDEYSASVPDTARNGMSPTRL